MGLVLVIGTVLGVLSGCGDPAVGRDGTWQGCPPASRVASVTVTREATRLGPPGGIPGTSASSRDAAQARRLFVGACRLVAADAQLPPRTAINCPIDFGIVYLAVFRDQPGRVLARATYHASGCRSLTMRVPPRAELSTMILGEKAPALAVPFNAALAAILGVPPSRIPLALG